MSLELWAVRYGPYIMGHTMMNFHLLRKVRFLEIGLRLGIILGMEVGLGGCQERTRTESLSPIAQKGKTVYQTYCTTCHHTNPRLPGALGPEIFGSSKELLEARVLRAEYPANYKPKRNTHTMAPFPYLKNEIEALHAYLEAAPPL